MFKVAFLIGIYSYLIFFLGVFGGLYKNLIIPVSLIYIFLAILFLTRKYKAKLSIVNIKLDRTSKVLIAILGLAAFVNLIGVFGPEISFDSLWYHLTLPKLYFLGHSIFHITGGLLYYSDMPKLTEMLYVGALSFSNEILAKLIHFSFGLLTLGVIYQISRKFLPQKYSLIAAIIFYSSLVVGWESITTYVDLSRAFFEILAFYGFLNWIEKKNIKWLIVSGLVLGLAVTVKLIALQSLLIFLPLFIYEAYVKRKKIYVLIKNYLRFVISAIIVPLPWLILSFINTGNPFYPYFSKLAVDSGQTISFPNLLFLFKDIYNFFLNMNDPISPLYLILLPIIFLALKKSDFKIKLITLYTFLAIIIWYLTEQARGSRFILPYLPAFSILGAYAIYKLKSRGAQTFLIAVVVFVALSSISYRALANGKYIPVVLGYETKSEFLSKQLNFSFGDFYDTDGYFKNHIKSSDKVLLYGFHNLYYVDFSFVDSSFVRSGDKFNYIAVQNSIIPFKFSDWKEVYYNKITKVGLYSKGGQVWAY